jgi:2-polyprenyl-3-methyl-5-hydroxy-6-metoxy-1,4-benzoquinol methylase
MMTGSGWDRENRAMDLDKYASQYAHLEKEWDALYFMNIEYRLRAIQPYFRPGSALELGSGGGHCTVQLAAHFDSLDSVEGSTALSARLRDRGLPGNVELHVDYFETFSCDRLFDNIFMIQILEHVDDPVAILDRYRRMLAPRGRLFISVPNSQSVHRLAAVEMGLLQAHDSLNEIDLSAGHRRVYSPPAIEGDLHRAGYRTIHRCGMFVKPLSNSQIVKQWNESMMRAFHDIASHFPDHSAEIMLVAEER